MRSKLSMFGNFVATAASIFLGMALLSLYFLYIADPGIQLCANYIMEAQDGTLDDNYLLLAYASLRAFWTTVYLIFLSIAVIYLSMLPYKILRNVRSKWRARNVQPMTQAELTQRLIKGAARPGREGLSAINTHPPVARSRQLADQARLRAAEAIAQKAEQRNERPE